MERLALVHSVPGSSAGVLVVSQTAETSSLFQLYYEDLVRDTGDLDLLGNPDAAEQAFQGLSETFRSQTVKVSLTRWFQWVDTSEEFLQKWHSRLLVQTFLCMKLGLKLKGADLTMPQANEEDSSTPTGRDKRAATTHWSWPPWSSRILG